MAPQQASVSLDVRLLAAPSVAVWRAPRCSATFLRQHLGRLAPEGRIVLGRRGVLPNRYPESTRRVQGRFGGPSRVVGRGTGEFQRSRFCNRFNIVATRVGGYWLEGRCGTGSESRHLAHGR